MKPLSSDHSFPAFALDLDQQVPMGITIPVEFQDRHDFRDLHRLVLIGPSSAQLDLSPLPQFAHECRHALFVPDRFQGIKAAAEFLAIDGEDYVAGSCVIERTDLLLIPGNVEELVTAGTPDGPAPAISDLDRQPGFRRSGDVLD
jgi:hypothetical protein